MTNNTAFIGLDTHKETIAVAIAEDGRDGEVRYFGQIANEPAAVLKLVKKLAGKLRQAVLLLRGRAVRLRPSAPDRRPGPRLRRHRSIAHAHQEGRARQE